MKADLVGLAVVTEDARDLVITLSGDVHFAANNSTPALALRRRLEKIARVHFATTERTLTVEDHTNAQGSSRYNRELSQLRVDAVRGYIISCGYPSVLVHARGVGRNRTVAENATAEGRTINQRIESIVGRADR